jgi:A/G-specific adenine glycosylase
MKDGRTLKLTKPGRLASLPLPEGPETIAEALLAWYDRHHRVLPWRVAPADARNGRRADPYHVWLSEIMLQQTTVQAVQGYFHAFTARWPRLADLAAASEDDILKAWAGLGYYSRARNLKKCADAVMTRHGGQFPADVQSLRALPGIGDYTSAAIAAIAFDLPEAVVDGNVERVVSRLHRVETPLPAAKKVITALTRRLTPQERPGDFAQAMMDLGATICTPRRPACIVCPLRDECRALAAGDPERYPLKAAKKDKPARRGAAFVAVRADGAILLRRRADTGLLAGMSEVPTTEWTARQDGASDILAAPFPADWEAVGSVQHVFTHFALTLTVFRADLTNAVSMPAGGWWSPPDMLPGEALPTVMRKAIETAKPGVFAPR